MNDRKTINRRTVLKSSLAAAAALPVGAFLASCGSDAGSAGSSSGSAPAGSGAASGSSSSPASGAGSASSGPAPSGSGNAANPFGLKDGTDVTSLIFNGGSGYAYVQFAATLAGKKFPNVNFSVTPSPNIAQQLQPQFVAGNPPDMFNNSGANAIAVTAVMSQVEELTDVLNAPNYDGVKIADTLNSGVEKAGMLDGKFLQFNYIQRLYAIWYSASLFKANSWQVPHTWQDALDLGAEAKKAGKYLFVWGKEASTYYQTLAMGSAVKEGGDEVWINLSKLTKDCWSHQALQDVFKAMEQCVKNGYFVPGGAGTQFTAAQSEWSLKEQALLYPSGSWIGNEMKDATKDGFQMTGAPEMTVSANSAMPYEALHSSAQLPFFVPTKASNVAGGKELLRALLSKESATNFVKTIGEPTVVKMDIPADGYGHDALISTMAMLKAAGDKTFDWPVFTAYGMNAQQLTPWNSFLSGSIDTKGLTEQLQAITDKVREDPSVTKLQVAS